VDKIIELNIGTTKEYFQKNRDFVSLNTFDDVFAHCNVFSVPKENKYIEHLMNWENGNNGSRCSACAVINLDKPILGHVFNKDQKDETIIEHFLLEYSGKPPADTGFGECFIDHYYPNIMAEGYVKYNIQFKHNENQKKYKYSVPH